MDAESKTPAALGLVVLLISLTVLFAAGFIVYWAARTGGPQGMVKSGAGLSHVPLPPVFWFSTLVIFASSGTIQYALVSARAGHEVASRRALTATVGLGLLFLFLQVPGLLALVGSHRALAGQHVRLYLVVLFLVGLHLLHVAGGLAPMSALAASARRRPFDASRAPVLKLMAIYWHYLAAVWLVMFNGILLFD